MSLIDREKLRPLLHGADIVHEPWNTRWSTTDPPTFCAGCKEPWPCHVALIDAAPPTEPVEPSAGLRELVTLIRIGFLVTVGGRRAEMLDVHGKAGDLLGVILGAKDTEDAVAALAALEAGDKAEAPE